MAIDAPLTEEHYGELRPLMFSIAYGLVSSAAEAEDIVQEAFIRLHRQEAGGEAIRSPKAFLSTATTNLAIDHLRSARVRRESYVGPWLPEPLVRDHTPDVAEQVELADRLSLALMVVLERLSPVQRAVFILREVLDYPFSEIAEIVGKSEENCRQLAARARRHVESGTPRFEASAEARHALSERFFAAMESGDMAALVELLADDVSMTGDGGGKGPALAEPIAGAERIARLLAGIGRQFSRHGVALRSAVVNGQPGIRAEAPDGAVVCVMSVDVVDGAVAAVRSVVNPDKLRHLGPVVDFRTRRAEEPAG